MYYKLKPRAHEVLVRVVAPEVMEGMLFLPDSAVKASRMGVVLEVGSKCDQATLSPGVQVLLPEHARSIIKMAGIEFQLIPEERIEAVIEGY